MVRLLDLLPFAAAAFALPQFLPQIAKLRGTDDVAGVSWPWAALTAGNNAGWLTYFTLSRYWTALVPSCSATLLAAVLVTMLTRRTRVRRRSALAVGCWTLVLAGAFAAGGKTGLGTVLTVAFGVQVSPSLWSAYRTARPTGIARGTWALVLGELSCWTAFGLHRADPRLIVLGCTGVAAAVLMLGRIHAAGATEGAFQPLAR